MNPRAHDHNESLNVARGLLALLALTVLLAIVVFCAVQLAHSLF